MKKYMEIPRIGHISTLNYLAQVAAKKQNIRIVIKLDGANGQFEVGDNDELLIYSRRNLLNKEMNLKGFYQYVISKVDPKRIPKGYKIFGEWLISHTVTYPSDAYAQFYLFNIYDENKKEYIKPESEVYQQISKYLVDELGMKEEIVLYEGPYISMDEINKMLLKITRANDEYDAKIPESMNEVFHEGLILKAYDYRDEYGSQLFVKYVGERFKEVKEIKSRIKNKNQEDNSIEREIAEFSATKARVEKTIHKLIDENVLPDFIELEHMDLVAKNLPKRVYEDIMKEELDTIKNEFGEFDEKLIGKKINSNVMKYAREIVLERIEERFNRIVD